ncbi:hypothetical protein HDU76_001320 [Blyttiomyces sp. JEL0837]|nr:hypothetical protein HDU76_001320 [Blyttiomyces sp. JEL0837]
MVSGSPLWRRQQQHMGDAVPFNHQTGMNTCGVSATDSDLTVALSPSVFTSSSGSCGRCVYITGPSGHSTEVKVIGECKTCPGEIMALSSGALDKIGGSKNANTLTNVVWRFCDHSTVSSTPSSTSRAAPVATKGKRYLTEVLPEEQDQNAQQDFGFAMSFSIGVGQGGSGGISVDPGSGGGQQQQQQQGNPQFSPVDQPTDITNTDFITSTDSSLTMMPADIPTEVLTSDVLSSDTLATMTPTTSPSGGIGASGQLPFDPVLITPSSMPTTVTVSMDSTWLQAGKATGGRQKHGLRTSASNSNFIAVISSTTVDNVASQISTSSMKTKLAGAQITHKTSSVKSHTATSMVSTKSIKHGLSVTKPAPSVSSTHKATTNHLAAHKTPSTHQAALHTTGNKIQPIVTTTKAAFLHKPTVKKATPITSPFSKLNALVYAVLGLYWFHCDAGVPTQIRIERSRRVLNDSG